MGPITFRRRSLRLKAFDYSQAGAYFTTICTSSRECLFGDICAGTMRLNDTGAIAQATWESLPSHYLHVEPDAFVVMPNHVHGIIVLMDDAARGLADDPLGAGLKPAPTKRHVLSEIVRAYKTFSARRINARRGTHGVQIWQRSYYEHVIRNEDALNRIREYIIGNPVRWAEDPENPFHLRNP